MEWLLWGWIICGWFKGMKDVCVEEGGEGLVAEGHVSKLKWWFDYWGIEVMLF